MAKWLFLERRPSRPAGGDAFRRMFAKLDPELALAREAIQNAVDAAVEQSHDQVIVEFELRDDCHLQEILGPPFADHASAPSYIEPDLQLPIKDAQCAGRVLLIHDYGTTGLIGDMCNMHSNFYRLMGGLGGSEKIGGGGSYGFGKAAAILNSELLTVFAYTVTNEGEGRSKFWGTCYFDPHRLRSQDYLGVGWYCHDESEDDIPLVLQDEAADLAANKLHIRRVGAEEIGTTLAIVHPSTGIDGLVKHIREQWWPRIAERANDASHQLIYIREGDMRRAVSLEGDKRVKPFLGLYEVARGLKEPGDNYRRFELTAPRTAGSVKLGTLALSLDPAVAEEEDLLDGIALVRNPRMVVTYFRPSGMPNGLRGIFIADPGMDSFLRKTEPHEHDDWNEKIPGSPSLDKARQYAKIIKTEIRRKVREYMEAYTPPPNAEPKLLPDLRRFLGNLFSTSGVGPPPPGSQPISITHKATRIEPTSGSDVKLVGGARFRNIGKTAAEFRIGVQVKIVESDLGSGGDPLLTTICVADKTTGLEEKPAVKHRLEPNEAIGLEFESESYNAEWTTKAIFWSERVES